MIQNDCSYELLYKNNKWLCISTIHHHTLLAQLVLTIAFGKITNTLVDFFQKNSQRRKRFVLHENKWNFQMLIWLKLCLFDQAKC